MTKAKLVVVAAGIVGSVVMAAFATGVPGDALKAFCEGAKTSAPTVAAPVGDAGP